MRYKPKTKFWPHQKRALKKLVRQRGGALFIPMRGGKTKVVLDFVAIAWRHWGLRHVVIVCPLSAIGVWRSQIRIHLPDDVEVTFVILNYERLYKRQRIRTEDGWTWEPIDHVKLASFLSREKSLMVVDESHRLSAPTSLQSKKAWRLGQHANWRIIMTGTPWHRKPLGIFGQFRFLDASILGDSFTAFKRQFSEFGGYCGYVVKRYINQKVLKKKVAAKAFVMKYVPLHPPTEEVVPVVLGKEAVDAYQEMARESLLEIKSADTYATAPIVLTRSLRLAQIAGGHVRDEEGQTHRVHLDLARAFKDWLGDRLEEGHTKIVVFCRFRPEIKDVAEVAHQVGYKFLLMHGGVKWQQREQRMALFDETEVPTVFIAQVQTAREGIDLSAAPICAYYNLPTGLIDFDQSKARIRKFKDKVTRAYYYFVPYLDKDTPTVVGHTLVSLKAGKDLAETMDEDPYMVFESAL